MKPETFGRLLARLLIGAAIFLACWFGYRALKTYGARDTAHLSEHRNQAIQAVLHSRFGSRELRDQVATDYVEQIVRTEPCQWTGFSTWNDEEKNPNWFSSDKGSNGMLIICASTCPYAVRPTLPFATKHNPALHGQESGDQMQSHCPIGRMTITGTITRVQDRKNEFETKTYITVRTDDGHSVTGTKPRGVMPTVGNRVEFVATVKRGEFDPYSGFFKNHRDGKTLSFVRPPALATENAA
ncbi:MAG: hypothetical protein WBD68_06980 [Candidatus Sulfotelmatobacter sp.]